MKQYSIGYILSNDTVIKNDIASVYDSNNIQNASDIKTASIESFKSLHNDNIKIHNKLGVLYGTLIDSYDNIDFNYIDSTKIEQLPEFDVTYEDLEHNIIYGTYKNVHPVLIEGLYRVNLNTGDITMVYPYGVNWSIFISIQDIYYCIGAQGILRIDNDNVSLAHSIGGYNTIYYTSYGDVYALGGVSTGVCKFSYNECVPIVQSGTYDTIYEMSDGTIYISTSTAPSTSIIKIKEESYKVITTPNNTYCYFSEDQWGRHYVSDTYTGTSSTRLLRISEDSASTVLTGRSAGWYIFYSDAINQIDYWCPRHSYNYERTILTVNASGTFTRQESSYDEGWDSLKQLTFPDIKDHIYFSDTFDTNKNVGFYFMELVGKEIVEYGKWRINGSTYASICNRTYIFANNTNNVNFMYPILTFLNGALTDVKVQIDGTLYTLNIGVCDIFEYKQRPYLLFKLNRNSTYNYYMGYIENDILYVIYKHDVSITNGYSSIQFSHVYTDDYVIVYNGGTVFKLNYDDSVTIIMYSTSTCRVFSTIFQETGDLYIYSNDGIYYIDTKKNNAHLIHSVKYYTYAFQNIYHINGDIYIGSTQTNYSGIIYLNGYDSVYLDTSKRAGTIEEAYTHNNTVYYCLHSGSYFFHSIYLNGADSRILVSGQSVKYFTVGDDLYLQESTKLYKTDGSTASLYYTASKINGIKIARGKNSERTYAFLGYSLLDMSGENPIELWSTTSSSYTYNMRYISNDGEYVYISKEGGGYSDAIYVYNDALGFKSINAPCGHASYFIEDNNGTIYVCSNSVDYNYTVHGLRKIEKDKHSLVYNYGDYWDTGYLLPSNELYISCKASSPGWYANHGILYVYNGVVKRIWDKSVSFKYVQETPNGLLVADTEFIGPDDKILYIKGDRVMETSINEINAYNKEANNE